MTISRPVASEAPEVSVVIPTHPDRDVLSLDPLRSQSVEEYEVIVVNDAGMDLCEARNHGIENASADIIALTDDDTKPPDTWLEEALDRIDGQTVILEGPVEYQLEDGENKYNDKPRKYVGCNLAFQKHAWEAVGGFNSLYEGWGDDVVFGWDIERKFGLPACEYSRRFHMYHVGRPNTHRKHDVEARVRRDYTDRYFSLTRVPRSARGKIGAGILQYLHYISPRLADWGQPYLS